MRNLKKYSNHSGYSADERVLMNNVSICKSENHTHYDKPYDSRIAYIEMPAGAYINSEQYITDITGMMYKQIAKESNIIGHSSNIYAHYSYQIRLYGSSFRSTWNATNYDISGIDKDGIVTCKLNLYNNRKWIVNDTEYNAILPTWGQRTGYSPITQSTKPLYLGACSQGGTDDLVHNYGPHKCFAAQVTQGSELVLDLIPVRVGTTGYMYDRVSNRLFGNSGTGTFTLGPDI